MNSSWYVPSLRGVLGNWVFYPSLMTAAQISERVMKSKDIRESKALDDYLQRDLKPRVKKIVRYLKTREDRFFNAILLGVFDAVPEWVEFDLSSVSTKLKLKDASQAKESIGLLTFSGSECIFAIDGQHRAEAIREANSKFEKQIEDDQYPVIFLAHIDNKEGKVRTRRLFSDINNHAVKVSKGDKVIIDEDDLSAIVTRRIYAEYPRFKKGQEIAVTEKIEQLEEDGEDRFTSLLAIFKVCQKLKRLFRRPQDTPECAPDNVASFKELVTKFFDYIIEREPSLRRYFIEGKTTPGRERKGNRNLVFRPIGLEILASLYVHFQSEGKLQILDWALKNLKWENPGGVLDGTVWLHEKVQTKPRPAALKYILYLLHELPDGQTSALLQDLREFRNNDKYNLPARVPLPKALLKFGRQKKR